MPTIRACEGTSPVDAYRTRQVLLRKSSPSSSLSNLGQLTYADLPVQSVRVADEGSSVYSPKEASDLSFPKTRDVYVTGHLLAQIKRGRVVRVKAAHKDG